jgi:hypothetical protein
MNRRQRRKLRVFVIFVCFCINEAGLFFRSKKLPLVHADLRISLRKMRAGQRSPRPLQRLERHRLSALRLNQIVQEIFGLRLRRRGRSFHATVGRRERRRWLLRRALPRALIGQGRRAAASADIPAGCPYLPQTSRVLTRVKSSTAQSG